VGDQPAALGAKTLLNLRDLTRFALVNDF